MGLFRCFTGSQQDGIPQKASTSAPMDAQEEVNPLRQASQPAASDACPDLLIPAPIDPGQARLSQATGASSCDMEEHDGQVDLVQCQTEEVKPASESAPHSATSTALTSTALTSGQFQLSAPHSSTTVRA